MSTKNINNGNSQTFIFNFPKYNKALVKCDTPKSFRNFTSGNTSAGFNANFKKVDLFIQASDIKLLERAYQALKFRIAHLHKVNPGELSRELRSSSFEFSTSDDIKCLTVDKAMRWTLQSFFFKRNVFSHYSVNDLGLYEKQVAGIFKKSNWILTAKLEVPADILETSPFLQPIIKSWTNTKFLTLLTRHHKHFGKTKNHLLVDQLLNECNSFVGKLGAELNPDKNVSKSVSNPEYQKISRQIVALQNKRRPDMPDAHFDWISQQELPLLRSQRSQVPARLPLKAFPHKYKQLDFVCYEYDIVIGIVGNRIDASGVKLLLSEFVTNQLGLGIEISVKKLEG